MLVRPLAPRLQSQARVADPTRFNSADAVYDASKKVLFGLDECDNGHADDGNED
jgi:hypothetical protein